MTLAFYAVVYNCENTILPFIEHIKIANEYVIIDDGSTDLTYENAIEFQTDKEFKCIKKKA